MGRRVTRFRHAFVISGPSGTGKATVMEALLLATSLVKVVTFATRPKRPNESDGVDYNFVSATEFDRLVLNGEITETVQVYGDYYYGSPLLSQDESGPDVLIELDTEGHARYVARYGSSITSIFLLPPSLTVLCERIQIRHQETNLASRLEAAKRQLNECKDYDYLLINDDLPQTCNIATAIVTATQQHLIRASLIRFAAQLQQLDEGIANV